MARVLRRFVTSLLSGLIAVSCASKFESGSKISSLRVLAVQKDKPYAAPGEKVHLRMLLDDGGVLGKPPPDAGKPDGGKSNAGIQILWFGGCENPLSDAYSQCFVEVAKRAEETGDFGAAFLSVFNQLGVGPEFDLSLSPTIIARRPPPANPAQTRYGSAFVLFTTCVGGTVKPDADASGGLPIGCFTEAGTRLGADAFVIGYTEVFAYETFTNANPIVTGFEVDGMCVEPDCVGDACIALEREELGLSSGTPLPDAGSGPPAGSSDAGGVPAGGDGGADAASDAGVSGSVNDGGSSGGSSSDAGPPQKLLCEPTANGSDPRLIDLCTTGDQDTCDKHTVNLVVDPKSAEHDVAQEAIEGAEILEQMWINYYADAGKLEHDVKLLNDATTGWNDIHSADLRSPLDIAPFHVWAVAHDNRGGSQWARVTLTTRVPASGFP